jgi:serine/threonine-protein kinase
MAERLGKYEITGEIGQSAFGKVFRARDTSVGRDVALKLVGPGLPSNAAQIALLQHPNIATVYDIGHDQKRAYFVTELVEGKSLQALLDSGVQLSVRRRVRILSQIARALHHAHKHGITHRDLRPGNVVLQPDGETKVFDFGIDSGTLFSKAPERVAGGTATALSDQFSVGVLGYQLFTGRHPFLASSEPALAYSITNDPFAPLENVRPPLPPQLCAAIGRTLAKTPQDRYPDLGAFDEDLRAVLSQISHNAEGTGYILQEPPPQLPIPPVAPAPEQQTNRNLTYLLTALLLCAAGLAAYIFWPKPSPPIAASAPTAAAPTATGATAAAAPLAAPQKPARLELSAARAAFLRLTADGSKVFGGTLEPGETLKADGEEVVLYAATPDALNVRFNGAAYPLPAAPTNEVRFTAGGAFPVRAVLPAATILWRGNLLPGVFLEIAGNTPTNGAIISGGPLPQVPHTIDVAPTSLKVFEAPSAANQWNRLSIRNDGQKPVTEIRITWKLN